MRPAPKPIDTTTLTKRKPRAQAAPDFTFDEKESLSPPDRPHTPQTGGA